MNVCSQMRNGVFGVIEVIMFRLIALCTKLLIESGMGGCNELQLSWFYVHG